MKKVLPLLLLIAFSAITYSQNPPKSIIGKTYITFFSSGGDRNYYFTVKEAPNDSIILEGFALGYDIKARYDPECGTITIPTGMVIGVDNRTGENVTLYSYENKINGRVNKDPIIGNLYEDKISFNNGLWLDAPWEGWNAGIVIMRTIEALESNAIMTYSIYSRDDFVPLRVNKSEENEIELYGISCIRSLARLRVPIIYDTETNTAVHAYYNPVDLDRNSNYYYFLMSYDSENKIFGDLTFSISNLENNSILSANTDAYFYYVQSFDQDNQPVYKTCNLKNLKITTDFNIFTSPIGTGSGIPLADVENIEMNEADVKEEYYNLQGHKVNNDHLSPGIYIVRKGLKTSKILIR